jgi:glycosyltransferase involved in cell wall biosynthesis
MSFDVPLASVVIPAHDESAVIGRCLGALLQDAAPGELDIVVACNGCTDDTAEVARSFPGVRVIEIDEASKTAAINAADRQLEAFPRFYVDADVELTTSAVRGVASAMQEHGVPCGAPSPLFDVDGRPYLIRAFYDVWKAQPWLREQPVGNGVYVLSRAGRGRFEEFPNLVADDLFVRNQFAASERYCSPTDHFTIHTPRTVRGLVAMRTRVHRGNAEIAQAQPEGDRQHGRRLDSLLGSARSPSAVLGVGIYVGVNVLAKLLARWKRATGSNAWERDESARRPTPAG